MARTAVTASPFVANSSLADPAGTNLDPTNGHTIAKASPSRTVLRVTNTASATKVVTVKAGASNPPAFAGGLGDLTYTLGVGNVTTQVVFLGPFDSSRFLQSDGSLSVDIASGATGTITAFTLPKSS